MGPTAPEVIRPTMYQNTIPVSGETFHDSAGNEFTIQSVDRDSGEIVTKSKYGSISVMRLSTFKHGFRTCRINGPF